MKKDNVLSVVFTIIGTIIGAGFASGKEIFVFFNIYGLYGIIGILISITIISLTIYKVLKIVNENEIYTYDKFIKNSVKNKYIRNFMKICTNVFLLISFYIMVSGFSTYFMQEYNLNYIYGAIIITVLSFIVFKNNIEGVIKINKYLIPILIGFIVIMGMKALKNTEFISLKYDIKIFNMLVKAILYATYNCIVLVPILISFKDKIPEIKQIKKTTKLVWIIMITLSLIIFFILFIKT